MALETFKKLPPSTHLLGTKICERVAWRRRKCIHMQACIFIVQALHIHSYHLWNLLCNVYITWLHNTKVCMNWVAQEAQNYQVCVYVNRKKVFWLRWIPHARRRFAVNSKHALVWWWLWNFFVCHENSKDLWATWSSWLAL